VPQLRRGAAVWLAVAGLISGACRPVDREGHGGSAEATFSATDSTAIVAGDSAFVASVDAGNVDGVAALYASDAALLPPNLPVQRGHNAIRAFWGGFLNAYDVKFELGADVIEGREDLAYNLGHYRFTAVPKAKNSPGIADEGKYVTVLKKQPDGSWKLVIDIYNSSLAPQH
jgi:ketosteroid isomerase-like protein